MSDVTAYHVFVCGGGFHYYERCSSMCICVCSAHTNTRYAATSLVIMKYS